MQFMNLTRYQEKWQEIQRESERYKEDVTVVQEINWRENG